MIAILSRRYGIRQTTGCLYLFDEDRAIANVKTLELPYLENQKEISCIPTGEYIVNRVTSPKFGVTYLLDDVPNRSSILIHSGNYASGLKKDTSGCILVGLRYEDINLDGNLDVVESRKAMDLLRMVLPRNFKLIIL
jgi:hypothetical protein